MSRLFLLLLILPIAGLAQDTALLKQHADRFAQASFTGDHKTVIDLTYPALIEMSGGRELMQKLITDKIEALKKRGVKKFNGSVGPPGKFYNAGSEIHCLIPESVILKIATGHFTGRSYLLAISNDEGQSWKFLDVGNMPPDILHRLVPNYNNDMVIPPSGKPMYFED